MSSYYSADGYYAKDDEQAKQASQWHGKGAAAAGLSGYVNPQDFQRVLDGNTPDGNKLGVVINGEL
ncbi:MAG: relaxase domain-containing protein, partial [Gammaproteobacteria bacterium]|nr:relaxase domain-containing protein [Gammaproteobacteria bacterium]